MLSAVTLALLPLQSVAAQVRFERTGYRLTSIGERIAVSARVVDARRRPVSNVNIRWRVADPSIASVTPQGVIVSRRVGYTKLWAVAGQDSASALILVDQWAAKFDFAPAVVRLDAVGAKTPLRIQVRDAAGHLIAQQNRKTTACRSLNERVASLAPNGAVSARANGVTHVRCTDRGIADSVRVEVRQRVERMAIADKGSFGGKTVGDTFRLQLRAQDRAGDVISDVQATWASLNPAIVNVDPLTGMARSVGPGDVKIIAQAGDVTDTVMVRVQPSAGMPMPVTSADTTGELPIIEAPRAPTLRLGSIFPFEGDTTTVSVTARDATGADVPNADVRLRSSDTTVVAILPRQRILPKKSGSAYVIGVFGTVLDSTLVTVRARGGRAVATNTEGATSTFKRPTFDTAAAHTRYRQRTDSARAEIFDSSRVVGLKSSGRLLSFSAVAGQAAHSFRDTTGHEQRTGLLYGGTAEVAPFKMLKLTFDFRTGVLSSSGTSGGTDLSVTEAGADLTFRADWFGFRVGYMVRGMREGEAGVKKVSLQQWKFPRVSTLARFNFVGGAVTTVTGISILPAADYSGYFDEQDKKVKPDNLSLAGEAGLELHTGVLNAGLIYYVEKFTFPKVGTSVRVDQFSTLRLRLGLQLGR